MKKKLIRILRKKRIWDTRDAGQTQLNEIADEILELFEPKLHEYHSKGYHAGVKFGKDWVRIVRIFEER